VGDFRRHAEDCCHTLNPSQNIDSLNLHPRVLLHPFHFQLRRHLAPRIDGWFTVRSCHHMSVQLRMWSRLQSKNTSAHLQDPNK